MATYNDGLHMEHISYKKTVSSSQVMDNLVNTLRTFGVVWRLRKYNKPVIVIYEKERNCEESKDNWKIM